MCRRRLLLIGSLLLAASPARAARRAVGQASADALPKLVDTLAGARSYKVRVQAIALLARQTDPRAFQAIGRAAVGDPHPIVRGFAVRALGRNPGGTAQSAAQARLAISRATSDRDAGVRKKAAAALAELDGTGRVAAAAAHPTARGARRGPLLVALGTVGDRTGRATKAVRDRMRSEMTRLLGRNPAVKLADSNATGVSFVIDATIAKLDLVTGSRDVEATCAVQLVVSRPPRGIVTVASGEATVQRPRIYYRPQSRGQMEEEALENAVKSAHDSLATFLAAQ